MVKEKRLDYYIAKKLDEAGIKYDPEGSKVKEIAKALASASKSGSGEHGYPEFTAVLKDFVLVIEDKKDTNFHVKFSDTDISIACDKLESIKNYAINGAIHYAKHIIEKTSYKKVFAIGASGDEKHHKIQPVFVNEDKVIFLDTIDTFENFSEENIDNYYKIEVLKETPPEELELAEIIKIAKDLHEELRNYGGLTEQEKPLVVSAILLALEERSFLVESLTCDEVKKDGEVIFNALSTYLNRAKVTPDTKKQAILSKFSFIVDRPQLNNFDERLNSSAIAFFTKTISNSVSKAFKINITEDILGRFYGEFVKYSGGDGKGLGIVLTPRHITELFCELLELKPSDIIFDPCCGTAGFLISSMHFMLKDIKDKNQIKRIKKEQIHGIEIRDDLFAIATTNMILRGDGKSNLRLADFIKEDITIVKEIGLSEKDKEFNCKLREKIQEEKNEGKILEMMEQLKQSGATVGMMNPPYSQAKKKDTAHLSELHFTLKLLDSLKNDSNSRAAVIVPQSTMVGKNKEQQKLKEQLLERHTLVSVITLNKETFYGVGTNPCIAIFKAHVPHDKDRRVKFFNFEDDGFEIKKHVGLVATPRALDRKKALLRCLLWEI